MSQGPITVWLEKWRAGDPEALDRMLPLVYSIAARTMRRILVDHARARLAKKRGGARPVIECRVWAELTLDETAAAPGLSRKSVQRTWTTAAAWLREDLGPEGP